MLINVALLSLAFAAQETPSFWDGWPYPAMSDGITWQATGDLVRVKKGAARGLSVRLKGVSTNIEVGSKILWVVGVKQQSETWARATWLEGETYAVREGGRLADVKVFVDEKQMRKAGFAPGAHDVVILPIVNGYGGMVTWWQGTTLLFKDGGAAPAASTGEADPAAEAAACVTMMITRKVPSWDAPAYCAGATQASMSCMQQLLDRSVAAWDVDDYCKGVDGAGARCIPALVDKRVNAWDADDYCKGLSEPGVDCLLGLVDRQVPAWDADDYCRPVASPAQTQCMLTAVDNGTSAWDADDACLR